MGKEGRFFGIVSHFGLLSALLISQLLAPAAVMQEESVRENDEFDIADDFLSALKALALPRIWALSLDRGCKEEARIGLFTQAGALFPAELRFAPSAWHGGSEVTGKENSK